MIEQIKKRDGRVVEFDSSKITIAIEKAGSATGEFTDREARKMTLRVLTLTHELRVGPLPEVEEIQDIVERLLTLVFPGYHGEPVSRDADLRLFWDGIHLTPAGQLILADAVRAGGGRLAPLVEADALVWAEPHDGDGTIKDLPEDREL